jgi:nicotinate-nucleotide pyrophosphorylase (carboxylating)
MESNYIDFFIENALKEDIGDGDHTSLACIPVDVRGKLQLTVKERGILAGVNMAHRVFSKLDNTAKTTVYIHDGAQVKPGDIAFVTEGNILALLQAERLVLNIMQRMSGIATVTRRYVDTLKGLDAKILDTRKTTPGMRIFEKEAVRIGGGMNHRFGLFDMILIKDNHIDFSGGIVPAIQKVKQYLAKTGKKLKIEVEARSIDDIRVIMQEGGINRILLDNFSVEDTRMAVSIINHLYETESSGGITIENIRQYAECGVDYISVGALTHHIDSLDLSLDAIDF